MKTKIFLSALLIFLLTVSCKKSQKELEEEYITLVVNETPKEPSVKWVVILPGMGCHGCIQEGEVFMRDHVSNQDIAFVLTKIESVKILQQKIEVELNAHQNIRVDPKEPTANIIYPCIVRLENGKISSYEFQSPDNNAFEKLRNLLAKS